MALKHETQKLFLDPDIYREAKAAAAMDSVTISEWITTAIKEKLDAREKGTRSNNC